MHAGDPVATGARTGLAVDRARLARVRAELTSVFAGLAEAVDWRPEPGRWSVGECALHVLSMNEGYLDRAEAVMARERAAGRTGREPFRYGGLSRWFLGQMEPGGTRRLPAPKSFRPSQVSAPPDVGARLDESLARLDRALETAEGLDLARAKVASPVSPLLRFPLGIALRMLVVHTERHLRQMERVVAAPGCPARTRTTNSQAARPSGAPGEGVGT